MSGFAPFYVLSFSVLSLLLTVAWREARTESSRKTVHCPNRAMPAIVVVQGYRRQQRGPWTTLHVVACSLQPGGLTCNQACLQGLRNAMPA